MGVDSDEGEVGFFEDTEGALVAGKSFETSGLTRAELGKLKLAVEALGKGLTVVPSGVITRRARRWGSGIIGIFLRSGGGYGPEPVTRTECLATLQVAKALGADVWKSVSDLLSEKKRKRFAEEEVQFYLVPVGRLAAAKIVFGKAGAEEDAGKGEYFWGQDMSQEPHRTGVWGLRVCSGDDPVEVDLSESAHQARVAAHPDGGYFVIARYD